MHTLSLFRLFILYSLWYIHGIDASSVINNNIMIASTKIDESNFQLLHVNFSNKTARYTPIGNVVSNYTLLQGDATAFDYVNKIYYAVLNTMVNSNANFGESTLFAFNATNGDILWRYTFPINYTMGGLAYEPKLQQLVGFCGELLAGNGYIHGYCTMSLSPSTLTPTLTILYDWNYTIKADADTRALDPLNHHYYHRVYNTSWNPDYFCTFNSLTGELLTYSQFPIPSLLFEGTRWDTASHTIYSLGLTYKGTDLCTVNANTGDLTCLNVFDRTSTTIEFFADSAVIDPISNIYYLTVYYEINGLKTRAVDINRTSPTYGNIIANYTIPDAYFPSNFHVFGTPDE